MIMRLDRLIAEIPPPSDPDPNGGSVVQELLGGKFGEMSTFKGALKGVEDARNTQQFLAGGASAMVQDSMGKPWNGDYVKRWSPDDFQELAAVFNGPHPETGEELEVAEELHPEGALAYDLPSQPAVFAPGPKPEEIVEIAQKLREAAGLPKEPTREVAN